MIRNNLIKKIGMAFALVGLLSTGVVCAPSVAVSAQEQDECPFEIESVTGDYTVLNPTYHLDCKNQSIVGRTIKLTTNLTGSASGMGYSYYINARGDSHPKTFGPLSCNTLEWTPTYSGLYGITVTCRDSSNHVKSASQCVEVWNPVTISSFGSDHTKIEGDTQGSAKLGETINFTADTYGGYIYSGKKYTYTISPRSAAPQNQTIVYYNRPSADFAWTPKYPGIYAINLQVTDELGSTATKELYYMINNN